MIRYSLNRNNSFMLRYRSSSTSPTLQQLQSVVDNTNPLFLSTGNPLLDQQINHTLNLRYTLTTMSGQTFIAMLGATLRNGYVADSTFVATEDITLPGGIEMDKGAQLTRPVNLDGYYSLQAMLTYRISARPDTQQRQPEPCRQLCQRADDIQRREEQYARTDVCAQGGDRQQHQ